MNWKKFKDEKPPIKAFCLVMTRRPGRTFSCLAVGSLHRPHDVDKRFNPEYFQWSFRDKELEELQDAQEGDVWVLIDGIEPRIEVFGHRFLSI